MKLSKLLFVGITAFAVTGCSLFGGKDSEEEAPEYDYMPTIVGGSAEEKDAIYDALNTKPICLKNGESTKQLYPDSTVTLVEDEGDNIKLTVKQVTKGKTVDIKWACDAQEYNGGILYPEEDPFHCFIDVKYKGYEAKSSVGSLSWKITEMKCGEAVMSEAITYTASVQNEQMKHENVRISDIYAFDPAGTEIDYEKLPDAKYPSTFNLVDYERSEGGLPKPGFIANNPEDDKTYINYYVNVAGKVVYLAPDGNFGIIADGEEVLEIYAGSGTALKESNFPFLKVGNIVKVSGKLAQYCGNVQVSFITKIREGKASDISPVDLSNLNFRALTPEKIASLTKEGFTSPSQAVKLDEVDMMGSFRQVTGTFVEGSMKQCNGKAEESAKWVATTPSAMDSSKRIMFKIKVVEGEKEAEYTVYYDKHTSSEDNICSAIKSKLSVSGAKTITVKGFSRYFGDHQTRFYQEGKGAVWTIVPFSAAHIS